VRDDCQEALALTILGGDGGEAGIDGIGQDGDFVAPLFEQALVDPKLLEPLDLSYESSNAWASEIPLMGASTYLCMKARSDTRRP
jgi:hypothetical protein